MPGTLARQRSAGRSNKGKIISTPLALHLAAQASRIALHLGLELRHLVRDLRAGGADNCRALHAVCQDISRGTAGTHREGNNTLESSWL